MMPVRLELATHQSRVKHSNTELLCSQYISVVENDVDPDQLVSQKAELILIYTVFKKA